MVQATKTSTDVNLSLALVTNPDEEKKIALDIFSNSLVNFLEASLEETLNIIDDYNGVVIALLMNDAGLKKDLEKALYKNLEKLTHQEFKLDNVAHAPSIRNWLHDFISRHGTAMFDNMTLTQYLTSAPNVKVLSEEEKKLVKKLLMLYRNIKFFPESMKDVPATDWQIIPIKEKGEEMAKARPVSGPPKSEEEEKLNKLRQAEDKYDKGSLEKLALEEEVSEELNKQKKIKKMQTMANRYKDGSLERKAIEEEIEKLARPVPPAGGFGG